MMDAFNADDLEVDPALTERALHGALRSFVDQMESLERAGQRDRSPQGAGIVVFVTTLKMVANAIETVDAGLVDVCVIGVSRGLAER